MSDIFDTLTDDPPKKPDIFDAIAGQPKGDIFDQIAPPTPAPTPRPAPGGSMGPMGESLDSINPDSQTIYTDALRSFLSGDHNKAKELAAAALKADPRNSAATRILDRLNGPVFARPASPAPTPLVVPETPAIPPVASQPAPPINFQQGNDLLLSLRGGGPTAGNGSGQPPPPDIRIRNPEEDALLRGTAPVKDNTSPLEKNLKEFLFTRPEESAPIVRDWLVEKLKTTRTENGVITPEMRERDIQEEAARTGKVPYGKILGETLTHTVANFLAGSIPMTPEEVALAAAVPKAIGAAAEEIPILSRPMGEILSGLRKWVSTKKVNVPISAEEVKNFYIFGKENLSPETYELLQRLDPEIIKNAARARQGVVAESEVARFGRRAPEVPGAAPEPELTGRPNQPPAVIPSKEGKVDLADLLNPPPPSQQNQPGPAPAAAAAAATAAPAPRPPLKPVYQPSTREIDDYARALYNEDVLKHGLKTKYDDSYRIEAKEALRHGYKLNEHGFIQAPAGLESPVEHPLTVPRNAGPGAVAPTEPPPAAPPTPAEPPKQFRLKPADIEAKAKEIHAGEIAEWERKANDPIVQYIRSNGGIAMSQDTRSEYKDIPLYLRGTKGADEMVEELRDAGLIHESNFDIYKWAADHAPAGPKPALNDIHYQQAAHELQGEYQQYGGPPKKYDEGPTFIEEAPFEKGPKYGTDSPIFYSQLQKTLESKMPNRADAQTIRNIVKPENGVKPEEVEWSGLNEWLAEQKGPVEKKVLLDFLKANEVQVKEVAKGDDEADFSFDSGHFEAYPEEYGWTEENKQAYLELGPYRFKGSNVDPGDTSGNWVVFRGDREVGSYEYLTTAIEDMQKTTGTKFSRYQLPGGENYRELLLTLPDREKVDWSKEDSWVGKALEQQKQEFRSSHFDEPNILAHVRFNDRTVQKPAFTVQNVVSGNKGPVFDTRAEAENYQKSVVPNYKTKIVETTRPERVLFLEEVQSDWHQKGREEGYSLPSQKTAPIDSEYRALVHKNATAVERGESPNPADVSRAKELGAILEKSDKSTIPDAPFKKTWPELAMKRMLRYAVENGYDKIAWTTGEQQAARYPREENSPEKIAQEKGMKGFYDQILPAFMNKYTKKWGGRVSETKIASESQRTKTAPVPKEVKDAIERLDNLGFDLRGEAAEAILDHPDFAERWSIPPSEAAIFTKWRDSVIQPYKTVHSLDITPSMRESISQGQALFDRQGDLFGQETVPATALKAKPKPTPEGQGLLFGAQAQPKFEVPKSAFTPAEIAQQTPEVQRLLATSEGKHQVPLTNVPEAIRESVIVKDLQTLGYLPVSKMRVVRPEDTAAIFSHLKNQAVESFHVLSLDAENKILGAQMVSLGILDASLVHPREVFRVPVMLGAKKIVMVHNHPSHNPKPSDEDLRLTRGLLEQADNLGIEILHHVVIDDTHFGLIKMDGQVELRPFDVPKPARGQVPVVSPVQSWTLDKQPAIQRPEHAADLVRNILKEKNGYVAIALTARNTPTAIWHLGNELPKNLNDLVAALAKIAMRANAANIIISGSEMPSEVYISGLVGGMRRWGIPLLDVTSLEGGKVLSAEAMGLTRERKSPYGTGETPADQPNNRFLRETPSGNKDEFAPPAENKTRKPPQEMVKALNDPTDRFQDLNVMEGWTMSNMAPIRAVEKMDGKRFGLMKKHFLQPIQDADKAYQFDLKDHQEEAARIFKGLSAKQKELIFDVIEKKGTSDDLKVDRAVAFLKIKYNQLLDRINDARTAIGKDPVQKRQDYITHYQELSAFADILQMMGMNMTDVPASMLTISSMTKPNSPYFKFAKRRLGEITGHDAERAYLTYLEPALRTIHFSRATKQARDILEYKVKIPSEYEGGKIDNMSLFGIRYPMAYAYFTRYLNGLAGKRDELDKIFFPLAPIVGALNRLFAAGSIGGNIGTIFTQPASIRNTVAETGLFAIKGQMNILTPAGRAFFKKNSRIGAGRAYEPSQSAERLMGSKILAKGHDLIAKALSIPVGIVDQQMVGGAFLAGYYKGKAMGLSEADAIRYADDVAERTQASANQVDRPPANMGKLKVNLGQFQTFVFNEWSQIKYDFLKTALKGEKTSQGYAQEGLGSIETSKSEGYKRFAAFLLATAALSKIYDELGLPNPLKSEGSTVPGVSNPYVNHGWEHVINQIPYVSAVRFGGSPTPKAILNGIAYLTGDERRKAQALRALKSVGVRLIPGGGQAFKTLGAIPFAVKEQNPWRAAKMLAFGKYAVKKEGPTTGPARVRLAKTRTAGLRLAKTRTTAVRVR